MIRRLACCTCSSTSTSSGAGYSGSSNSTMIAGSGGFHSNCRSESTTSSFSRNFLRSLVRNFDILRAYSSGSSYIYRSRRFSLARSRSRSRYFSFRYYRYLSFSRFSQPSSFWLYLRSRSSLNCLLRLSRSFSFGCYLRSSSRMRS
jgi:hypothetical protein